MIASEFRFHGRGSLNKAYRAGKTIGAGPISLRYFGENRRKIRIAVVVSKKVSKSAVVRNVIRRRLYEIVREKYLEGLKAGDYVFTVHNDQVLKLQNIELEKLIRQTLERLNVLN